MAESTMGQMNPSRIRVPEKDEGEALDATEQVYWDEVLSRLVQRTRHICRELFPDARERSTDIFLELLRIHYDKARNLLPSKGKWKDPSTSNYHDR